MKKRKRSPVVIEALEPRILYSADPLGGVLDSAANQDPLNTLLEDAATSQDLSNALSSHASLMDEASAETIENSSSDMIRFELVIVDTATPNYQALVDDIYAQSGQDIDIDVVLLDSQLDGLEQISEILSGYENLDAIHLISHGDAGEIQLGSTSLDLSVLNQQAGQISAWSDALDVDADLLIYGCNLASTEEGEQFINALAQLTEADVAASDDLTGNQALGGDWELEYSVGEIETEIVLSEKAQQDFDSVLANSAPVLAGANDLAAINEDPITNAGTLVSVLVAGQITDADSSPSEGIALIGIDNANGTWQYTTDGSTWQNISSPSASAALLLASDADNAVRFVPDSNWNGTVSNGITFHAWDQTTGADGATVNLTANETVRDNFSSVSYSNNDGTQNWTTDWIETDSGGASSGDIRITSSQLRIDLDSTGDSIYREVNLDNADSATLSFNFSENFASLSSGSVDLDIWNGSTWTQLERFDRNTSTGVKTYDISAYTDTNTRIRFDVSNDTVLSQDIRIDNVQIAYVEGPGGTTAYSEASSSSSITVNAVNDAATVSSDTVNLNETNAVLTASGTLTSTDVDNPDNTFTVSGTTGTYGNFGINAAGVWTYTAHAVHNELAPGQSYSETFNVTSVDGTASTVQIIINGTNDNPTLSVGSVTATEDQLASGYTVNAGSSNLLTGADDVDDVNSTLVISQVENSTVNVGAGVAVTLSYTDGFGDAQTQDVNLVVNADGSYAITAFDLSALPDGQSATGTFNYTVKDDAGLESGAKTANLTVTGTNDLPVNTVPGAQTVAEDTPLGISSISVADVDGNLSTVQLSVTQGTVAVTLSGAASISAGSNSSATLTLSGTQADINATLSSLIYQGTSNYNGGDTLTVLTTDSNSSTDSDSVAITVSADNDLPINTVPGAQTVAEDTPLSISGISVTDVEGISTVQLSVTQGTVAVTLSGAASISAGSSGSATLTLSGTQADINSTLSSLIYQGTLNYNGADTLTVLTTDSNSATDSDTVAITVTADNDLPVNTVPGAQTVAEDTPLSLSGISVTDTEGIATVQLSVTQGTVAVTLSGSASISSGSSGSATLTLSGTQADINTTLSSLIYQGTLNYNGGDTLTVLTTDSNSATDSDTVAITVSADNDLPVNTVPGAQTVVEDTPLSLSGISVNDVEGISTVQLSVTQGTVAVTLSGSASISAGSSGSATLTLSGTQADINTTLSSLIYQGTLNYNGGDTLTVLTTDSNSATDSDTVAITVTADNDLPVNTVPGAQTVAEDTPLSLSGISVADTEGISTVQLSVTQGTVAVTLSGSASISAGSSGSATLTLSGTQADINTTLSSLVYQGTLNYNGGDTLTVLTTDSSAATDSDTVSITVTADNDAPINTVPGAQTVAEDTPLSLTGISVNDVEGGLLTVQLTVTQGTVAVTLSGSASISAGSSGSATLTLSGTQADINSTLNSLIYQGGSNYNGGDTLTVLSTDSNTASDSDTVAITVTAQNDTPTLISISNSNINENTDTSAGQSIGTLTTTDDAGDTATYSIQGGDDAGVFSIGGAGSDELILTDGTLNHEVQESYQVIVRVTDSGGLSYDETLTVLVGDLNEGPSIVSPLTINVADSQTNVTRVAGFDEDIADTLTYTITGGVDAGDFNIDNNGLLTFASAQNIASPTDSNGDGTFLVQVTVADGNGLSDVQNFTIILTDANAAPVLVAANDLSAINEDPVADAGTLVTAIISGQVSDADTGASQGVAITNVDNTNGTWQYTTDGSTWQSLASTSFSSALLLAADSNNAVRFVPNADWNGTVANGITFYAWDQSTGSDGATVDLNPTHTLRDQFDTASYSNNDGTLNWTGDWIEVGDWSGASGGDFRVTGGELRLDGQSTGDYIYREANLDGVSSATLSYDVNNTLQDFAFGDKEISLQISSNGGSSWTSLHVFNESNNGTSSLSHDISAYTSDNTQIRFVVTDGDNQTNYLEIDNLQISYVQDVGGSSAFSSASASSSITVNAVNDAATVSSAAVALNETDIALVTSGTLTSTDVDNPNNSFTASSSTGSYGSFSINTAGAWSFTANAAFDELAPGQSYTDTFNVSSVDGTPSTVQITINGTNDNPTLTAGSVSATEDQLETGYSVDAGASNLLTGAADSDDVNSSLVVGQVNGVAGNVGVATAVTLAYTDADGAAQTQNINLTVNADGSYALAAFDLDDLPDGQNASVSFTYTSQDDQGLESNAQTATITISGTNDNPSLSAGSISASETQLELGYSVDAGSSNLLTGAADSDDVNSTLVVGQVNGVSGNVGVATAVTLAYIDGDSIAQTQSINLTVNADGSYALSAFDLDDLPAGQNATVTFTYTSKDDQGAQSSAQTATITISGSNDNPTLTAGSISATEDQLELGYSVDAGTSNLLVGAADSDDVNNTLVVGQVNGVAGNVGTATAVTLAYTDADGSSQTQSVNLTVNANGSYALSAFDLDDLPDGQSATVTFSYTSKDDQGAESSGQTATITITGTNDNPTLSAGSISATEDQLETGYSVDAATSNLLTGAADSDDVNSSLVVGQVNGASGNVGVATAVTLAYTDADGAAQTQNINLTVNADGSYALAAFDLDGLPDGQTATVSFTYTSKDDQGAESSAQTATITISGSNDNPTLSAGSISATEDQLEAGYSVDVGTSTLLTSAADSDDVNSSLVIGQVNGVAGNVGVATAVTLAYTDADGLAQTQSINLTVNADGSYNLAAFDLDELPDGQNATVTFTYTAKDDQGAESSAQTAVITISGSNDNPTLTAGSISATENQLETGYSVDVGTSTLLTGASDSDDVNSSLVIGQVNGAPANVGVATAVTLAYTDGDGAAETQNINLTVNADGSYALAAFDLDDLPAGQNATVTFTYTSMDDQGAQSSAQTTTITITGTNDNPTLTAGSISATEDQLEAGYSVDAATSNLLADAADSDDVNSSLVVGQVNGVAGNVGVATAVTLAYTDADGAAQTQNINLTVNADGSYALAAFDLDDLPDGQNATVTFTYTSQDDQGAESSVQTTTITIAGTNDNPTLSAGSISATESQLEAGYSVDVGSSNLLTAAADSDDVNGSLVVGQVNGVAGNVGITTAVTLAYTDADGLAQTQNINLTVNADGSYALAAFDLDDLPAGQNATVTFTYTSMDDQGAQSSAQTATITISGSNDNPTLTAGSISATEDQLEAGYSVDAATSNLLTAAADNDDVNSSLVIGQVNGLAGNVGVATAVTLAYIDADGASQTQSIDLTVNGDGSYALAGFDLDDLPASQNATVTFTYTAQDDQGAESSAQTAAITISGTNDNPTLTAGSISATEDQLEAGYSVDAGSSNLLAGAADSDDVNSSLVVGQVNGSAANVGVATAVTLAYTDADGVAQTQNINLTVNANGSYSLGSFDLSDLPSSEIATVTFTYTSKDDQGLESSAQTATLSISGTNDNPTLVAGSINATEDQLETGVNVNAATSDLLIGASDVDDVNSSVVIGQVNGAAGNVGAVVSESLSYLDVNGVVQSQAINLTVNADGSYSIGAFDLDALPAGNLAVLSFTYTAMDDQGLESAVQTTTLTVTGTNDNPSLLAGDISATEDQLQTGYSVDAGSSNLLTGANDFDDINSTLVVGQVNGAAVNVGAAVAVTLSYTDADGVGQTQSIDLTVNADGSYALSAFDLDALPSGQNATVNFTYTAKDDQGLESASQAATLTISGTNDNPSLSAGSISATEDQLEAGFSVAAGSSNLLTGADDIDDANSALVVGRVNGFSEHVGSAVAVTLLYTDVDSVAQTQNINLTVNADGSYALGAFDLDDLPTGQNATVLFTYSSMDDQGLESSEQTATITISGTNDNPTLVAGDINLTEDQLEAGFSADAATSNLLTGADDIDDLHGVLQVGQVNGGAANVGNPVAVTLTHSDAFGQMHNQVVNLTVNADGSYAIDAIDWSLLQDGSLATVTFTYTAQDDQGLESLAQTAIITITGSNDNPVFSSPTTVTASENQVAVSTLVSSDVDIGDGVTYSITGGNDALQFNLSNDGQLTFSSALNFEFPVDSDGDGIYEVEVTATDDKGASHKQIVFVDVSDANDLAVGVPQVLGDVVEDQTLTADISLISDEDGLGVFQYQWLRDGLVVEGATQDTYTLGDADVSHAISVQVTYTDANGAVEGPLTSSSTVSVVNVNDAPEGVPVIVGSAIEDQVLTVDTSDLVDLDGLGEFSYQWFRGDDAISGATESNYVLGDDDVANEISVQMSYTDGYGTQESTPRSASTVPVENINDAPVIESSLAVEASENQSSVLTVSASDVDMDDILSFSITGGADGGIFSITPTGELTFTSPQDFENYTGGNADGSYSVEITVLDRAGAMDVQTIRVIVTDVNDTPTISEIEVVSAIDNTPEAPVDTSEDLIVDSPASESGEASVVAMPGSEQEQLDLSGLVDDAPIILSSKDHAVGPEEQSERGFEKHSVGYTAVPLKFIDLNHIDMTHHEAESKEPARVSSVTHNASFVKELNQLNRDLDKAFEEEKEQFKFRSELVVGTTLSLTAGIVSWLLRGGALLASFMSSAPLWKQLDPLPIVGAQAKQRKALRDKEQDDEEDDEGNQVEALFDDGDSK